VTPPEHRPRFHSCDEIPRGLAKSHGWDVYDVAHATRAVPAEGYVDEVHFRCVLLVCVCVCMFDHDRDCQRHGACMFLGVISRHVE
jgi:hypothetical protein